MKRRSLQRKSREPQGGLNVFITLAIKNQKKQKRRGGHKQLQGGERGGVREIIKRTRWKKKKRTQGKKEKTKLENFR